MAQPQSPLADELERVSADLDKLIGAMRAGRPSQTQHDGHVDQVEQLAIRMRRAVRGPGRPENPPIGRCGRGYIW
ncbi:hypothetical protein [Sphingomonas profundi]|uniref:hypothetical protein n=1 Tax=Alterirhizorhabdus profundi TaxID=2681549 RepID=UPI0012E7D99F|nr:hypothetical protein [Sphingomonas profundi]